VGEGTSAVAVKAEPQLGSCAARKRHGKEWLFLVDVRGKTRQLAPVVSTSFSKATRALPQENAEACCLIMLSSDRGRACSVSNVSVQPIAYAQQFSGLACTEVFARVWCLLTCNFDLDGRLLTASTASKLPYPADSRISKLLHPSLIVRSLRAC